jgi:hypothetical protein
MTNYKPLNKEAKTLILRLLQRGYFLDEDISWLNAGGYMSRVTPEESARFFREFSKECDEE